MKSKNNNAIGPVHIVALECLSSLICPVYGDFYSFPWKRGPHDNILDYTEAQSIFENTRDKIFMQIKDFDFVGKALAIFNIEDETKSVEVKCSVLRMFNQMLRSFDNQNSLSKKNDGALDMFLSNPNLKNILT